MKKVASNIVSILFLLIFSLNSLNGQRIVCGRDSLVQYINEDSIKDYIITEKVYNRPYTIVNLTIGVSTDSTFFKEYKKRIDLGEGITSVQYITDGEILTECISYDPRMANHNCSIYKYFRQLDDWIYYGSKQEDYSSMPSEEWEFPNLSGIGLYEENKGIVLGDSTTLELPDVKDSIIQFFNDDYSFYLLEYKAKKYAKLLAHDSYRTLDYLNFIEINSSAVQRYNDIGFFLSEAGNYQQAIYILENVIYKFQERAVAYLNLADAYFNNGQPDYAVKAYMAYIDKMKAAGKTSKIPKRIWERVK